MSSALNELVRRLALLAGPCPYSMTAYLQGEKDDPRIELRATQTSSGEIQEFARHITLNLLEREGAASVAKDFAREARLALTGRVASVHDSRTRRIRR